MKYLAFDIEIAKTLPEAETDWETHRPLGITCAAAYSSDLGLWNWYAQRPEGAFATHMRVIQCLKLARILQELVSEGYTIVTWNGLGFDFDILAEESGLSEICHELALNHIDMMFHFFCERGYPLGLDAACKGLGLPGKPEGMDGALAPVLWGNGEYHKVLDYVSQDVKNTMAFFELSTQRGGFEWTSRKGRRNEHALPEGWLTVREAMDLPKPDTSWMSDPWPRSKFYGWLERAENKPD